MMTATLLTLALVFSPLLFADSETKYSVNEPASISRVVRLYVEESGAENAGSGINPVEKILDAARLLRVRASTPTSAHLIKALGTLTTVAIERSSSKSIMRHQLWKDVNDLLHPSVYLDPDLEVLLVEDPISRLSISITTLEELWAGHADAVVREAAGEALENIYRALNRIVLSRAISNDGVSLEFANNVRYKAQEVLGLGRHPAARRALSDMVVAVQGSTDVQTMEIASYAARLLIRNAIFRDLYATGLACADLIDQTDDERRKP